MNTRQTDVDVVDHATDGTPRRAGDWMRLAPFFAVLCAAFAWLKSVQYHGQGQLRDEQVATLLFVALSVLCVVATLARLPRYRGGGRKRLVAVLIVCVLTLGCDALAVWNLTTATGGAKDRLF
jgi:hypothetical protein